MGNPFVVVMGVTGSGKSTVGSLLAERTGVPFLDADTFHDHAAIAAMRRGVPLDDAARRPWLERTHEALVSHRDTGVVLACSALKSWYREQLAAGLPELRFVALRVPEDVLARRLELRRGHFADPALLPSQLATLELTGDVVVVDAEGPAHRVVGEIVEALGVRQ